MLTIHKYQLDINDIVELVMPQYARILSIQVQHGIPCLWAVVDTDHKLETRKFRIFGTGQPIDTDLSKFVGTIQAKDGSLVFHVFEDTILSLNK